MCLFVFTKLIPLSLLCRYLSDISKERYDTSEVLFDFVTEGADVMD